jgi:hypothetical protein
MEELRDGSKRGVMRRKYGMNNIFEDVEWRLKEWVLGQESGKDHR